MLASEAGLEISLQGPFLSVAVLLPEKFLTHTRGLLGTFNNDPADDFTLRSGEVLPPSASSRELFRFGADCKRPQAGAQGARPWKGSVEVRGAPRPSYRPGLLLSSQGRAECLLPAHLRLQVPGGKLQGTA